ncbi:MAG: hypothetical protein PHH52_02565 [Patescibacteria group bacterium]|jgi:hypothetical protein|nr:hypothetical protein [Patescibacteria group bacterium]MDD3778242.1 hypothetical protein [Patescibacteria group bacterium]MDD3939300.1 hypothetical protein [Patescibacteria group bacterium]MDD4443938.1 hypothetical protein [Patescibacteria group bacterium]NCU39531.1 hypothetical protein [Candidatus Falkowbacteria bacterium]
MEISDVSKNLSQQTERELDRRLGRLLRKNPSYRHLDQDEQDLILDILEKYKKKRRRGIKISDYSIRKDTYKLYQKRLELGLSTNDLDKIKELLNSLKD